MKISVTADHIATGHRADCWRCPLARAFKDAGFDVMIKSDSVDFYDPESGQPVATLPLPPSAQHFLRSFDDWPGNPNLAPFEFEMPGLHPGVLPRTQFVPCPVA